MTSRFRAASIAAAILVLAACSPPNQQDTTQPKIDTASDVAAPTKTAKSTTKATVDSTSGLKDGDKITVNITGLDPTLGYYAAICADDNAPVPVCTGNRGDTESQVWIKSDGGTVTMDASGAATVTLTAVSTGEGIDCTTDSCVLKVFGDHAQNFADVTSVPVTFAH